MEEWLDVPQLAKETGIPATTIHRYLNSFKQFFTYKGGKRSRRYNSSAIAVLLRIKDLYSKGFGTVEVEKKLSKEFPALLSNEEAETELDKAGLPSLATAEDTDELKKYIKLLLQRDAEKTVLLEKLIQEKEEEKALMESLIKAITQQNETPVKALPDPELQEANERFIKEQQETNERVLKEVAESKQLVQLLIEKSAEKEEMKEEEKEVAAMPIEEKKKGNFFSRFFK